eukprot:SAG22_NODE_13519_length_403_cov_45.157895_1_plen_67_part_01
MNCCICYDNVFTLGKPNYDDICFFKCHTCDEGVVCSDCNYSRVCFECPVCRSDWRGIQQQKEIVLDI